MTALKKTPGRWPICRKAKEDLSCLPTLDIEDIDPDIQTLEETSGYEHTDACCHELPTSGIFISTTRPSGSNRCRQNPCPWSRFSATACRSSAQPGTAIMKSPRLTDLYTGGMGLSHQCRHPLCRTAKHCLPVTFSENACVSESGKNV
ncbi:MAG: hypothetical protein R2875_07785 [Desulfobacterales bacterium]